MEQMSIKKINMVIHLLIYARYYGGENIVRLLIENGADVNKENKYGNTPFNLCTLLWW